MSNIYKGVRIAINFTVDGTTTEFVAHLVERVSRNVIGLFSYPARTGYETLTPSGNNYSGVLTEAMTIKAGTQPIDIEIKAFVSTDNIQIGVGEVARAVDNTVKSIQTVS